MFPFLHYKSQRPANSSRPASTSNLYILLLGQTLVSNNGRFTRKPLATFCLVGLPSGRLPSTRPGTNKHPFVGRLNQAELSARIDPILASPDGTKEHLHNQLIAAIYGNVTREMPDQGLAPWVSANDKPSANTSNKPVSGDAAERRLKGEVMQLPSRDRRRIKDLAHNDVCETRRQLVWTGPLTALDAVRPLRVTV